MPAGSPSPTGATATAPSTPPLPVQRFGLGGMFGGLGALEGLKRTATDPQSLQGALGGWPAAMLQIANRPGLGENGQGRRPGETKPPNLKPEQVVESVLGMEPKKLQLLAARLYPFISARIKTELVKDRERAGMITGLHR